MWITPLSHSSEKALVNSWDHGYRA
jgi:hypothetical protein